MALGPTPTDILKRVEAASGIRVEVLSDPSLPVPAMVRMARGMAPVHIATVNPQHPLADGYVAFEAMFILRLFANPPSERFHFGDSGKGAYEVTKLVRGVPALKAVPQRLRDEFATKLHAGLMLQLRSQPLGLRIHDALKVDYPDFLGVQEDLIASEQQTALQGLDAGTRSRVPERIFTANMTMNTAVALHADRLFGKRMFAVPYESAGLAGPGAGAELLSVADAIPADPTSDRALVEAWAKQLNLTSWIAWLPVEAR
jgi:hypothetical protein